MDFILVKSTGCPHNLTGTPLMSQPALNASIDSAGLGARRGAQVLQRLRDNPPNIWYRGELVRDVTTHPALRGGVLDAGRSL